MPRYDYRCEQCRSTFELWVPVDQRDNQTCPRCGGTAERVSVYPFAAHIWKPQWFEHIDVKPIYIESKKQLKRECEKRGLIATWLE